MVKLVTNKKVLVILFLTFPFFFLFLFFNQNQEFRLLYSDKEIVNIGKNIYLKNCASCHGKNLEGQKNWQIRQNDGYLLAPPHDKTGHTWHHSDYYLFMVTKFGIEEIIKKSYPNNMPIYKDLLNDKEIISVLSYIKSTWPEEIRIIQDKLNENR